MPITLLMNCRHLQALGDIPPSLQNYIDYEAYGRDLSFEGTFIETSYGMCEIIR